MGHLLAINGKLLINEFHIWYLSKNQVVSSISALLDYLEIV